MAAIYAWFHLTIGDAIYTDHPPSVHNRLVEMFHREADVESKERVLRRSMGDTTLRCVVVTIAFGLGVNIPDVDIVINWGPPTDTLTLWQEMGRCARDGRRGLAVLYK